MARPFAHLEAIQMRLDSGIFLPKAWSHPCAPYPAPQRKEIAHSALPGRCWQNGMGPSDAGGTLGSGQYCFFVVVFVFCIPRPGCSTLHPFPAPCYARPWSGYRAHAKMYQTQPVSPRRDQDLEEGAEMPIKRNVCKTGCRGPEGGL